jgi:hypothetical protein
MTYVLALLASCGSPDPQDPSSVEDPAGTADKASQSSVAANYTNTKDEDHTPLGQHTSLSLKPDATFSAVFRKNCSIDDGKCSIVKASGTYTATNDPCPDGTKGKCGRLKFTPTDYQVIDSDSGMASDAAGNPTIDDITNNVLSYVSNPWINIVVQFNSCIKSGTCTLSKACSDQFAGLGGYPWKEQKLLTLSIGASTEDLHGGTDPSCAKHADPPAGWPCDCK